MIALAGIGSGFHLAEKGIHFGIVQAPSGAHRPVAGNGRQHMGQSVLQRPAAAELDKFVRPGALRVRWLLQGRDVRGLHLHDLLASDVVFTTFQFLRASMPYQDLVDAALGGRLRARPALAVGAGRRRRRGPRSQRSERPYALGGGVRSVTRAGRREVCG